MDTLGTPSTMDTLGTLDTLDTMGTLGTDWATANTLCATANTLWAKPKLFPPPKLFVSVLGVQSVCPFV